MRGEKGQALILTIILLAVGALLIVPTLQYASTGLNAYRVSKDLIEEQYAADAGVEDALWRLKYDEDFPDNPVGTKRSNTLLNSGDSITYDITVNGINVTVVVEAPPDLPDTVPWSQRKMELKLDRNPRWIKMGDEVTYTLKVTNTHKNKELKLSSVGATLPPGFTYVNGSSNVIGNITTNDPAWIYESGKQKLTWTLADYPIPKNESRSQVFRAISKDAYPNGVNADGGIYYTTAGADPTQGQGPDWERVDTGEDAPVWVSMYQVTATAGKVTIRVSAGLTAAAGDIKVFSWQEE